ncbi:MAG: hypothetical protein ABIR34_01965, partial [Marmoricola sp.]
KGPSMVQNHHGSDPSSTTLTSTQSSTTNTTGSTGSTGSTSSGTGDSGTGDSGTSTFPGLGTGPGTGSCDPAAYPGGYSDTFAVPSPCAPVKECGAYLGSVFVTKACPADPAGPKAPVAPVITTQMVTEAAKVTAPVSPPHVEPGNRSYVHIPNNYWTDAPTVNTSITLLGQQIPLRWTPSGTTWSFGDGASATGNGVQGADVGAPDALEHSYGRQGSFDITTTTNYNLTFVLPGGGTQTVQLVSPPSPPVTLPVSEIQTRVSYLR